MTTRQRNRNPQPHMPTTNTPPDHIGLLIAAMLIAVAGWFGLYRLIFSGSLPRFGELWLFFVLLQLAIIGTVMPVVRYLNVRFTPLKMEVPASGVIVRQSVWIGLYVVTCAWLQIPRALTPPLVIFIAVIFIVVEVFLRTREIAAERS